MEKLIRSIITTQEKKLDKKRSHYTPEDLLGAGVPDFLVRRMRVELNRRLDESVTMPESNWADMSSDAVKEAWNRFLEAVHQGVRMPVGQAESVLEASLKDLLGMMVTPRAFLPDYIFGNETELDRETVKERLQGVVVYEYFATAIPRFMEKKQREVLTKEQADRIIERLDERVTSKYSSLGWAALFDPWFELMGESIDSEYFAMFFRDKGKPGVARLFDAEKGVVNRDRLIEIISRPLLYDDDELDDVGTELLGPDDKVHAIPQDTPAPEKTSSRTGVTSGHEDSLAGGGTKHERDANTRSRRTDWSRMQSQMARKENERGSAEERKGESVSQAPAGEDVNDRQKHSAREGMHSDVSSERNKETGDESGNQEENLVARFRKVNGDKDHETTLYSHLTGEHKNDEEPLYSRLKKPGKSQSDSESNEDEVPIWQQFTQVPYEFGSDEAGSTDAEENNSRDEEHMSGGASGSSNLEEIRSYVTDMEKEFISELFNGDKNAYLMALDEISQLNSWSQAGQFISREVFEQNVIDIYSDTAIYFTDRMQTYFSVRS